MKHDKKAGSVAAFTLLEMLIVVTVIGFLAAVAIPMINRVSEKAADAKIQRNAQSIASVFAAAQGAGLDFFVSGDEAATIQAVVDGGIVNREGPFKDHHFGVPNISLAEQVLVATYLDLDNANSLLVYLGP